LPPDEVKARESAHAEAVARLKADLERAEGASDVGRQVRELAQKVTEAEARVKAAEPSERDALARELDGLKAEQKAAKDRLDKELKPLREALARKEKESPLEGVPLAYAVREGQPTDAKVQKGGNPRTTGEVVPRGVPTCLDPGGSVAVPKEGSGRLELARWLTAGLARSLSARVMVNRIWQHHFGKPIVPTPSDFGLRGTPPTHPELLDWLANEFIASGWSVKAMHRRIMLSKTYRLACADDPACASADTGNAWYWRADRRPLDAESMRDTLLVLGGNLDRSRPGPHPFPPAKSWQFSAHRQFKALYPSDRRSVYLMVQRLHPHPYLALFNGPDTSMTTAVRDDASVPLQSLFMLNSPFLHDQAGRFARSLIADEPDPAARVRLAYLWVYARPPTDDEQSRVAEYLARYEEGLASDGVPADRRAPEAWSSLARVLLASNEFLYVE
jgi:hypothetical protein